MLKRVFDIDMQHCPNCGASELKIISAILGRPVIASFAGKEILVATPPTRIRQIAEMLKARGIKPE